MKTSMGLLLFVVLICSYSVYKSNFNYQRYESIEDSIDALELKIFNSDARKIDLNHQEFIKKAKICKENKTCFEKPTLEYLRFEILAATESIKTSALCNQAKKAVGEYSIELNKTMNFQQDLDSYLSLEQEKALEDKFKILMEELSVCISKLI